MRLVLQALLQCRGEARLADTGLPRNYYKLAVTLLDPPPAPEQQLDLLLAAD